MKSQKSPGSTDFKGLKEFLEKNQTLTWFDMGLLLDQLKDERQGHESIPRSFATFKKKLNKGVAFVNFDYGIDGVSIEIAKYGRVFERILKSDTGKLPTIHLLGGKFKSGSESIIKKGWKSATLAGAGGFHDWDGYDDLFHNKLARGSEAYNLLAEKVWSETGDLCRRLGSYVEDNDIQLLIPVNISSNPGNLPLAFAMVLVSEKMGIPVYNSCHDFYWEMGKRPWQRPPGEGPGLRDHFFTNADVGEVFSLIEMLYPWDSPLWFHALINPSQLQTLSREQGFNFNRLAELGTAVDLKVFKPRPDIEKHDALKKLESAFKGGNDRVNVVDCEDYLTALRDSEDESLLTTPIVLGNKNNLEHRFDFANILLLQPTRILKRKRIDRNFNFIQAMLEFGEFREFFDAHKQLRLTLLVSGPLVISHFSHFIDVIETFRKMLADTDSEIRDRIFLAFEFGCDRMPKDGKIENVVRIEELFSAANLIMLPSDQEGRGLPLLEAAATGVPILCRRYFPEEVFDYVVGKHLQENMRLQVFEFSKTHFTNEILSGVTRTIVEPADFLDDRANNRTVIKQRYSFRNLGRQIEKQLNELWDNCRVHKEPHLEIASAFKTFDAATSYDKSFRQIALCENRKYMPGIGQVEYMCYLKSLIDPSYFRIEERESRGRVISFGKRLVASFEQSEKLPEHLKRQFFQQLEQMYTYHKGKHSIIADHSLSYRHRSRKQYVFRKYTELELFGITAVLFRNITGKSYWTKASYVSEGIFRDFKSLVHYITGNRKLGIDDSKNLIDCLKENRPIGWFSGVNFAVEARLLVKRTLGHRLGISVGTNIGTEDLTPEKIANIAPVTLFVREVQSDSGATFKTITSWFRNHASDSIRNLYKCGLLKVVKTEALAPGTHLAQLGKEALKELLSIKKNGGFVVAFGDENMLSLDLLDLHSFRIGLATHKLCRHFLAIAEKEAYVQWVPAGLRPSLAYPTPIQTPQEFSECLKSDLFQTACEHLGLEKVLARLREDADRNGSPIKFVLEEIVKETKTQHEGHNPDPAIKPIKLNGLHQDGSPWSGAKVVVPMSTGTSTADCLNFVTAFAEQSGQTVIDLAESYERKHQTRVSVAWNGGYILNPELVGKLGLPEKYIGTPLGLLISNGVILSPPLFNKPALAFQADGGASIRKANLTAGITIRVPGGTEFKFASNQVNKLRSSTPLVYDLMFEKETIPKKDKIVYRLAGNRIIERLENDEPSARILPVGLVVTVPKTMDVLGWNVDAKVEYELPKWADVKNAVEAGPLLVADQKIAIDMNSGGWKTSNSIATQAARIDFNDMRGPKIGVGLSQNGDLVVVCINGRIRESIGATHTDLAEIFLENGAVKAMGFDPGGSATLVLDGNQLNISPYNKDFEQNPYTLKPQPRFIGNAVLGTGPSAPKTEE